MKHLSSQEIRNIWLNFFKERGHMIEPGASLIPQNDPTLLWINAGVSALKKYFDGSEIPESKRIVNVQKCIRTNDITNVGKTARHHTFFEMLGNFSIGDYFRKEIVNWAFDILTNEKYFGLDKEKLYVTYHPNDLETKLLWIKEGLKEDHLIPLEGNFWQIGEGPCGPNTEVFYDRGEKYDKNHLGIKLLQDDIENDRYIEIWGIVFSQFNAVNGVKREDYKELPHKNIDTGAGLERITCVLQETETNFETDLFFPIIEDTMKITSKPYEGKFLMPYRVIADHIRACTFALADGANFSNEGRGYVLRRLLRRAMRYGQKLGLNEPFLYKLVSSVLKVMKDFYPYLIDKQIEIEEKIKAEEEKFIKTLNSGESILNQLIASKKEILGSDAFKLYDTYGFPIELTMEICEDHGISIDLEEFKKCLEKQKELARNSRKVIESFNKQSKDLLEFKEESHFEYLDDDIQGKVIGLFKDGVKVDSISDSGEVIFDITNFYAEMGGEVSDTGTIFNNDFLADVYNVTKAPNKQHLHHIEVKKGILKLNDVLTLALNKVKHENIKKNHSATHLLQSALIEVLGNGVKQKGSYVCENYLRFDFSYPKKIEKNQLIEIESKVNEMINENIKRVTEILPIEEAKKTGAIAEFGEKYGSTVRVVKFGNKSIEFCGGCHVDNTNEIGLFIIKSEESIASGVRRIEALTGIKAYELLKAKSILLDKIKESITAFSEEDIVNKINAEKQMVIELNKKIQELTEKAIKSQLNSIKDEIRKSNDINYLIKYFNDYSKKDLINVYDNLKVNQTNYIFILVGNDENKHPIIVGVSKNLTNQYKAKEIIKKICLVCGGNGGGKEELSQGNIADINKFNSLKIEDLLD